MDRSLRIHRRSVRFGVPALAAMFLLSACAAPVAPTPPHPAAARTDTGGWVTARVEQPAEIEAQASDHPVFCSPCHPTVGSYISSIVDTTGTSLALGFLSPPLQAAAWTSVDGAVWKRVDRFPGGSDSLVLSAVGDAGGTVAVGGNGRDAAAWRSVDGSFWTIDELPGPGDATVRATSVVRTPTGYVAAGYIETSGQRRPIFWRSLDGTHWLRQALAVGKPGQEVTALAAGGGTIIATGIVGGTRTGTATAWRSQDDGVTWDELESASFAKGRMLAATAQGSLFVAVGENVSQTGAAAWTSMDGQNWTAAPAQPALDNDNQEIVMTAVASTSSRLYAVGWKSDAANGSAVVWSSSDGATWQVVPPAVSFSGGGMSAVNAANGVIAGGTVGWPDTHAAQVWSLKTSP